MEAILTQRVPAKDFINMYFEADENAHLYELMEGEIIRRCVASTLHQRISRNLFMTIHSFVASKNLGELFFAPIDVVLDIFNVFQPDLVFVGNWQKEIVTSKYINGSPDLAVEIISPGSVMRIELTKSKCTREPA